MNALRLALFYLRFHRAKTVILVVCVGLTIYLPLVSHWLVGEFDARMTARVGVHTATPLVIGARGSRFDLVLHALNFRPLPEGSAFGAAELQRLREDGLAAPVPLFLQDFKQRKGRAFPIVGTTMDYLDFRSLGFTEGGAMALLGDCVLGAEAARALGAKVGDAVTPDPGSLADLTSLPLKMRVTGTLKRTHTADDAAIFTDLKTAWIIAGHGHGHESGEGNETVFNAALETAGEVDGGNLGSFHFHDPPEKLPLTAVIALPKSEADSVILQGQNRFLEQDAMLQALEPAAVVGEMLDVILRAKRFIDANQLVVAVCTGLFLGLVILLSLRLRRDEMETLFQLGCSRAMVFWLQVAELGIVVMMSVVLALLGVWVTLDYVDGMMRGMGL
ncbi:MAG: hypothetical protein CMO74_03705 [Verrucomicrobiales bacterium]|nr:hypothetical protein [Verrucomicrobiales bacterium]|tara:strand:+ start:151 stop:1317 length:1167 start_codon:yes stop_codon:yes gene_type:complete